jgi:monoamine oxidase
MVPGSVILSTPVKAIRHNAAGATVTAVDGSTVRAQKVIVSVPTPLYKDIHFSPPLSGAKLELSSSTRLGYFTKVILFYSRPWWTESGLSGLSHSFEGGPITLIRDTSTPECDCWALTCFVLADAGREWSKLSASRRRNEALAHVAHIFGNREDVYSPIEVFEQEWAKEEFSKGCPCPVTGPNVMSKVGHAIREPFGNIHFVGTETAIVWKGYMEGAVRSGERGAIEVIDALSGAGSKKGFIASL